MINLHKHNARIGLISLRQSVNFYGWVVWEKFEALMEIFHRIQLPIFCNINPNQSHCCLFKKLKSLNQRINLSYSRVKIGNVAHTGLQQRKNWRQWGGQKHRACDVSQRSWSLTFRAFDQGSQGWIAGSIPQCLSLASSKAPSLFFSMICRPLGLQWVSPEETDC